MSTIVHRGALTEQKLKELCENLQNEEGTFVIKRQEDGNFIGTTVKYGTLLSVRDVSPEYCLQGLLTHDGKIT